MYNFVELWGGTDNVFEGVENWIGPGESFELTYRYALIEGIGKVDYADEHVAIGLNQKKLKVLNFRPTSRLKVKMDGKAVAGPRQAGPASVASFELPSPAGRFEIRSDDKLVFSGKLPLELRKNTSRHEQIRKCSEIS